MLLLFITLIISYKFNASCNENSFSAVAGTEAAGAEAVAALAGTEAGAF